MKHLVLFILAAAASFAADGKSAWFADPVLQARIGYDTNPVGAGDSALSVLGGHDAFTASAGLNLAVVTLADVSRGATGRLTYAAETFGFDGWSEENYTTHRLAATGEVRLAAWKLSLDASTLFVDGSHDTLASLAGSNANAISVWRERRAQWQHRARFLAQREVGALVVRLNGSLLDYDYLTQAVAGHVGFSDRSDLLGGADLGWKSAPNSLWFAGVRAGTQYQAQIPLPNYQFDYSNRYARLIAGWEGKLGEATTFAVAAGPDFRHFDGDVDPRVFAGRDRTSLWFETSVSTKLTSSLTLTGKATRWAWLSSTGKSAYLDLAAESALVWTASANTALRLSAKAHQCDYYPAVRNDWEGFGGIGATHKLTPALTLTADLLLQRGWNALSDIPERAFSRTVATLGAAYKF